MADLEEQTLQAKLAKSDFEKIQNELKESKA